MKSFLLPLLLLAAAVASIPMMHPVATAKEIPIINAARFFGERAKVRICAQMDENGEESGCVMCSVCHPHEYELMRCSEQIDTVCAQCQSAWWRSTPRNIDFHRKCLGPSVPIPVRMNTLRGSMFERLEQTLRAAEKESVSEEEEDKEDVFEEFDTEKKPSAAESEEEEEEEEEEETGVKAVELDETEDKDSKWESEEDEEDEEQDAAKKTIEVKEPSRADYELIMSEEEKLKEKENAAKVSEEQADPFDVIDDATIERVFVEKVVKAEPSRVEYEATMDEKEKAEEEKIFNEESSDEVENDRIKRIRELKMMAARARLSKGLPAQQIVRGTFRENAWKKTQPEMESESIVLLGGYRPIFVDKHVQKSFYSSEEDLDEVDGWKTLIVRKSALSFKSSTPYLLFLLAALSVVLAMLCFIRIRRARSTRCMVLPELDEMNRHLINEAHARIHCKAEKTRKGKPEFV